MRRAAVLVMVGALSAFPAGGAATVERGAGTAPSGCDQAMVAAGAQLYAENCAVCHGQDAVGGIKDLRHMTPETHAKFSAIVLDGLYLDKGMAGFAGLLSPEEAEQIHRYLIARAHEDRAER